jgi:hypothetical protein
MLRRIANEFVGDPAMLGCLVGLGEEVLIFQVVV